jgi:SpoVK/Ycf46/Vps4 family AAA+-type ATPase
MCVAAWLCFTRILQLDGAGTTGKERVLVVGATNRPQELDEAARRRLVKKLYIPLPDASGRLQLLRERMGSEGVDHRLSEEDYLSIMTKSEGYSGSDMAALCTEAAMGPIRSISSAMATDEDIESMQASEVRPIALADFDAAFQSIRPSVNQKDLDAYVRWNTQYGSFPLVNENIPVTTSMASPSPPPPPAAANEAKDNGAY